MTSIANAMLAEFEQESRTTQKFLERVPQDKLRWKPHEKSHTAGELALHVATLPEFVARFALVDASPVPNPAEVFKQPATVQDILAGHEKSSEAVRQILPTLDDARLMTHWSATIEGKPVLT